MFHSPGRVVVKVATVVPVTLLVLYAMILGLLGLLCGTKRRAYVTNLNRQALKAANSLRHGPDRLDSQGGPSGAPNAGTDARDHPSAGQPAADCPDLRLIGGEQPETESPARRGAGTQGPIDGSRDQPPDARY
jgi:hypothetical protein